jgi:hypothetical protein
MGKIILLAMLALCAAAFAANWQDEPVAELRDIWEGTGYGGSVGWQALALLALATVFGFATLVYMFGRAFGSEPLKRWAKAEFMQAFASFFIVIFLIVLLGGDAATFGAFQFINENVIGGNSRVMCGTSAMIVNEGGPFEVMRCKLKDKIGALDSLYDGIYRANRIKERLASACFMLFGMQVFCGDWNSDIHNAVEQNHMLGEKIIPLQIALQGQFAFTTYLERNLLNIFLPLGILMRIFPLTRGTGGLFIALAIGFYVVFPTAFILTDPSYVRIESEDKPPLASEGNFGISACYPGFRGSAIIINSFFGSGPGGTGEDTRFSRRAIDVLPQLTIEIMFYPFIAFVITLMFVRAATPVLGGDTGELMRMVSKLV